MPYSDRHLGLLVESLGALESQLMRHGSRKRASPEPLEPVNAIAWLVVRNALSQVVESTELAPRTDLRAMLNRARSERLGGGWSAGEIGSRCAFFFASRDGERVLVGIERRDPHGPLALR